MSEENQKIKEEEKIKNIIRVEKNKDNLYVMINKNTIQDKNLSWKAKGILAYLLTLPDNWKIYVKELCNHATDGRDSTYSALQELRKNGYVKRNRLQDELGKFTGYEYIVKEVSDNIDDTLNDKTKKDLTVNGKSVNGQTVNGKPTTTNTNITNIYNTNNKEREESPPGLPRIIKLECQEPTENEILSSEYNTCRNTFKSLLKKYRLDLTKSQIDIACMTNKQTEALFKDIKRRQKFDGDRRLDDFEMYAINFMMSTANFVKNNFNFTFFLTHYEKFFEIKKPYEKQEYKTEIQKKEEAIGSGSYLTDEWILAASRRDVI